MKAPIRNNREAAQDLSGRERYLLFVLMLLLAFNTVERLALGIVLQDIKLDLDLSDTELGLMSGIAFALFYSAMGIPIARWADRGNRVTIMTVTTLLWSLSVSLCALAGSFVQLLLLRVGVAIGEAGCVPPAHSLIADFFERARRPRAVARFMLGAPLAAVGGYFAAGWLNQLFGWRTMFLFLSLPGVVLAALVWFTIREPRRKGSGSTLEALAQEAQPAFGEVWRTLWRITSFRHLLLGYSILSFFSFGLVKWMPAFFMRSFGMQSGDIGTWFALTYGLCGLVGTYLGGELAARRAANNEPLQLRVVAFAYSGFGVVSAFIYVSTSAHVALLLLGFAVLGINTVAGPLFATIQTLVPERMRAMSIALIYFFANLIGLGLGPLAAGALSDALHPALGEESLRYALLALCPGYLWAGIHFWRASRSVAQDLGIVGQQPLASEAG